MTQARGERPFSCILRWDNFSAPTLENICRLLYVSEVIDLDHKLVGGRSREGRRFAQTHSCEMPARAVHPAGLQPVLSRPVPSSVPFPLPCTLLSFKGDTEIQQTFLELGGLGEPPLPCLLDGVGCNI